MKIHLPPSAWLGNIDYFLRGFDPSNPAELEITADKRWVGVHPLVLSMVAALGLRVERGQVKLDVFTAASKNYFERMGLFRFLGVESGINITEHEAAGRFIPITRVANADDLDAFTKDMVPLLHLEPQQERAIRYVIDEMARNVLEHAYSRTGAIVAAQYYPKANLIRIGIADTGVGIKRSITESHAAPTDLDAIRLALTPGITGVTAKEGGNERNAGAGLFFTKSIATVTKNFFVLYSGSGMYKLLKTRAGQDTKLHADPFADRHKKYDNLPYWQGTAVGIDFTLNITDEFSRLLDQVRDTFEEAIRLRKRQRAHKQPKFL